MESRHDYRTLQHIEQFRRIARPSKQGRHDDDALLISVLAGFPDRVAQRRAGNQVLLSTGVSPEIAGEQSAYEFMVAIDAEDRKDKPLPLVRMTSRVEPEWLIDLFPDRVWERSSGTWNRVAERVEAVSTLLYDDLVIQESRDTLPETEAASDLLCSKALEIGIGRFVDGDSLEQLRARVEFAGLTQPDIAQALRELCSGLRSFADLKAAAKDLLLLLEQKTDSKLLRELAPVSVRLQSGRQTKSTTSTAGRLGWHLDCRTSSVCETRRASGPTISPLVIHLLAPNQRAVQTTTDLPDSGRDSIHKCVGN